MRIVSLLPSTTEIICDLGLEDELLGVTAECNWPDHVKVGREIVVRSFADAAMTPGEIDEFVRQRVDAGLDLYELDDDALQRCDPDLILSQDLCRVCAVASGDVDAATGRLNCNAHVLQIDPQTLGEVLDSIVDDCERGERLAAGRRVRVITTTTIDQGHDGRQRTSSSAACSSWSGSIRPSAPATGCPTSSSPRAASRYSRDRASVRSPRRGPRSVPRSQTSSWSRRAASDSPKRSNRRTTSLDLLPASAEVWAIDADAVMVRPGPRLVDGVEALASLLHAVGDVSDELVSRIR